MEQKYRNLVNEIIQQVRPHAQVINAEETAIGDNWQVILHLTKSDFSLKIEFILKPEDLKHRHRICDWRDFIVINFQDLRRQHLESTRSLV